MADFDVRTVESYEEFVETWTGEAVDNRLLWQLLGQVDADEVLVGLPEWLAEVTAPDGRSATVVTIRNRPLAAGKPGAARRSRLGEMKDMDTRSPDDHDDQPRGHVAQAVHREAKWLRRPRNSVTRVTREVDPIQPATLAHAPWGTTASSTTDEARTMIYTEPG